MESVLHLTQLLLSSREDAADPCALVVVANTCIIYKVSWVAVCTMKAFMCKVGTSCDFFHKLRP